MRESLERYGHDQPLVFYTDNMADKEFLENCFPSLREAVISVEKYSHLPALAIPANFGVHVLDSIDTINRAMQTIIHDIPEHRVDEEVVIFLDSEWNVETSHQGHVTGRGQTAILQIAYKEHIYIIQVCFTLWACLYSN